MGTGLSLPSHVDAAFAEAQELPSFSHDVLLHLGVEVIDAAKLADAVKLADAARSDTDETRATSSGSEEEVINLVQHVFWLLLSLKICLP